MSITLFKPTELLKAKYISKKRGPDGKWIYKYPSETPVLNPKAMEGMSANERIKHSAAVLSGKDLPKVSSYSEVPEPPKVTAKDRKGLSNALHSAVPGDFFESVPMAEMKDALRSRGYVLIQEDGTEWAGMLLGSDSHATFAIGKLSEGRMLNGMATYKPVPNVGLHVSWYHSENRKTKPWEVIKYIS